MTLRDRYRGYWLDFRVSATKLARLRAVFFALVGIDAFLQIEHAARYGAGGFNVSHLPWLDTVLPTPGREGMLLVFLLQAYLGLRIALGGAIQRHVQLLAGLFAYSYFISQLNSYQHHYLVALLLGIACFVPWDRPGDEPPRTEITSWALRLILVQLSIMYAWAAIAKLEPGWLDGTAMASQIRVDWARDLIEGIGGFDVAARLVIATELALAVLVQVRRLWPVALLLGVGFHLTVELSGFEIGLFSYFMVALYLLVVPERWLGAFGGLRPAVAAVGRVIGAAGRATCRRVPGMALVLLSSVVLLLVLPFEGDWLPVAVMAAIGLVSVAQRRPGGALAHALVMLALCGLHAGTDQAFNHHKYWAGSARRLGNHAEAERAYRKTAELQPDYGSAHYYLGRFAAADGRGDEALEHLERAMRTVSAEDYRPHLLAAQLHLNAGRPHEAYRAALQAAEIAADGVESATSRGRRASAARALREARSIVERTRPRP